MPPNIDELAPAARRIVMARYFDGESVKDIAREEGREPNSISVTLTRCRKTLGKCLAAHGVHGGLL